MRLPNIASVVALLAVLLPVVMRVVNEVWPTSAYWWSALVVGIAAAVLKAIEVWRGGPPSTPPPGVAAEDHPTRPALWREVCFG